MIEIRRLALTQLPHLRFFSPRRLERFRNSRREGSNEWKEGESEMEEARGEVLRDGEELRAVKFLEKISENSLRNEAPEVLRHKKPLFSISFHAVRSFPYRSRLSRIIARIPVISGSPRVVRGASRIT